MSDNNINEYTLLKLLLEQLNNQSKDQTSSVNTVTTLWIILFGLIVIQKVFKYIIRPTYRSRHKYDNHNHNSSNDNDSTTTNNSSESI